MEVETLCFMTMYIMTMDGAVYREGQGTEASQDIENRSWMSIPAWQWPKTHGQGNKGVAQEEAH